MGLPGIINFEMKNMVNYIFNSNEIRDIESYLFAELNYQPYELMKKAGETAFAHIIKQYPKIDDIIIFCGKGNNAGDGYVVAGCAEKLAINTICVELYDNISELAKKVRNQLRNVKFIAYQDFAFDDIAKGAIIIDAMLGIGLQGELRQPEYSVVSAVNKLDNIKVAIDIPTGVNSDTGRIANIAFKADLTISFIAPKFGLFMGEAKDFVGKLEIANLGVDEMILKKFANQFRLLDFKQLYQFFPHRKTLSNKGSYGHLLLIGGFDNMPGAILLAAEAAYRIGAGRVTIATQSQNFATIISRLPDVLLMDINDISEDEQYEKQFDAIVTGPGLGRSQEALNILKIVTGMTNNKVIDADALNLLANEKSLLPVNAILTPHVKEAARLLKIPVQDVLDNQKETVLALYKEYSSAILLKNNVSLLKLLDEKIYISPYGNSCLAKSGTGDVLSGIIGGLLAQGLTIEVAAKLGVVIHGRVADLAIKNYNKRSILASDLVKLLGEI